MNLKDLNVSTSVTEARNLAFEKFLVDEADVIADLGLTRGQMHYVYHMGFLDGSLHGMQKAFAEAQQISDEVFLK